MALAPPKGRRRDLNDWLKDHREEHKWEHPREGLHHTPALQPKGRKQDAPRPENQLGTLLRVARKAAQRQSLAGHAEALANDLEVSVEWIYSMAVLELMESREGYPKEHADALRQASPYWQVQEYTSEELDALLEADQLTPELAERYKDLLED
jgi:ribosomal protein S30